MNREIKFRGKRLDNGEWIYGSLRVWNDGTEFPQNCYITEFEHWGSGHEVDPKTVSQYTGLKDKNGKEIYEGDLYSAWDERSYYAVEWNEKTAGFQLVWVKGDVGDSKTRHYFDMLMAEYQFEPVGNIYENPELLK